MNDKEQSAEPTRAELYFVYQSLESRRATYDTMVWQTTAISLAAQSFLLTLALGRDSKAPVRVVAALLSFAISLMAMQLMAKHRWGEILDSHLLEELEGKLGLEKIFGVLPHGRLENRISPNISQEKRPSLERTWTRSRSSYRIWQFGLSLFGFVALAIVAVVLSGFTASIFGN